MQQQQQQSVERTSKLQFPSSQKTNRNSFQKKPSGANAPLLPAPLDDSFHSIDKFINTRAIINSDDESGEESGPPRPSLASARHRSKFSGELPSKMLSGLDGPASFCSAFGRRPSEQFEDDEDEDSVIINKDIGVLHDDLGNSYRIEDNVFEQDYHQIEEKSGAAQKQQSQTQNQKPNHNNNNNQAQNNNQKEKQKEKEKKREIANGNESESGQQKQQLLDLTFSAAPQPPKQTMSQQQEAKNSALARKTSSSPFPAHDETLRLTTATENSHSRSRSRSPLTSQTKGSGQVSSRVIGGTKAGQRPALDPKLDFSKRRSTSATRTTPKNGDKLKGKKLVPKVETFSRAVSDLAKTRKLVDEQLTKTVDHKNNYFVQQKLGGTGGTATDRDKSSGSARRSPDKRFLDIDSYFNKQYAAFSKRDIGSPRADTKALKNAHRKLYSKDAFVQFRINKLDKFLSELNDS